MNGRGDPHNPPAGRAAAVALCMGAALSRSVRGRAIAPPR